MSTVFITGGSRGIGAAAARTFAFKGWNIAFCYHESEEQAMALHDELSARGVNAIPIRADVADPAQAQQFIDTAVERVGEPDALVCNAGIALPQDVLTDVTDEQWRRLFAVNVDGVFHCVRAALPGMLQKKDGCIVTVSSMWGQVGASCEAGYSATKGAVIALSKALAQELGPSNIRVNSIAPGVIDTDMCANLSSDTRAMLRDETPLERLGQPDDVAKAAEYLADADFITGQVLAVNGGFVIT